MTRSTHDRRDVVIVPENCGNELATANRHR